MIDPAPDPPVELLKAAGEGLTKAEIERGARTIAEEHGSDVFSDDHERYEFTEIERDQYRAEACAVMVEDRAGLMAAGRLLPEPVETREDWGLRWPDGYVKHSFTGRDAAIQYGCGLLTALPEEAVKLVHREVQVFADGRELIGPWVPVPDPQEG